MLCRDGVASLNDMKDMLASLPQYQEQREKVACLHPTIDNFLDTWALVLVAFEHSTRVYGHF